MTTFIGFIGFIGFRLYARGHGYARLIIWRALPKGAPVNSITGFLRGQATALNKVSSDESIDVRLHVWL